MGNHESNLKKKEQKDCEKKKKKKFRQRKVSDVIQNVEVSTDEKVKKKKSKFKFRRNKDKKKKENIIEEDTKEEKRLLNGKVSKEKIKEKTDNFDYIEAENIRVPEMKVKKDKLEIIKKEDKKNTGILKLYCSDQSDHKKAGKQKFEETKAVNIKTENVVKGEILSTEVKSKPEPNDYTRKEIAVLQCLQAFTVNALPLRNKIPENLPQPQIETNIIEIEEKLGVPGNVVNLVGLSGGGETEIASYIASQLIEKSQKNKTPKDDKKNDEAINTETKETVKIAVDGDKEEENKDKQEDTWKGDKDGLACVMVDCERVDDVGGVVNQVLTSLCLDLKMLSYWNDGTNADDGNVKSHPDEMECSALENNSEESEKKKNNAEVYKNSILSWLCNYINFHAQKQKIVIFFLGLSFKCIDSFTACLLMPLMTSCGSNLSVFISSSHSVLKNYQNVNHSVEEEKDGKNENTEKNNDTQKNKIETNSYIYDIDYTKTYENSLEKLLDTGAKYKLTEDETQLIRNSLSSTSHILSYRVLKILFQFLLTNKNSIQKNLKRILNQNHCGANEVEKFFESSQKTKNQNVLDFFNSSSFTNETTKNPGQHVYSNSYSCVLNILSILNETSTENNVENEEDYDGLAEKHKFEITAKSKNSKKHKTKSEDNKHDIKGVNEAEIINFTSCIWLLSSFKDGFKTEDFIDTFHCILTKSKKSKNLIIGDVIAKLDNILNVLIGLGIVIKKENYETSSKEDLKEDKAIENRLKQHFSSKEATHANKNRWSMDIKSPKTISTIPRSKSTYSHNSKKYESLKMSQSLNLKEKPNFMMFSTQTSEGVAENDEDITYVIEPFVREIFKENKHNHNSKFSLSPHNIRNNYVANLLTKAYNLYYTNEGFLESKKIIDSIHFDVIDILQEISNGTFDKKISKELLKHALNNKKVDKKSKGLICESPCILNPVLITNPTQFIIHTLSLPGVVFWNQYVPRDLCSSVYKKFSSSISKIHEFVSTKSNSEVAQNVKNHDERHFSHDILCKIMENKEEFNKVFEKIELNVLSCLIYFNSFSYYNDFTGKTCVDDNDKKTQHSGKITQKYNGFNKILDSSSSVHFQNLFDFPEMFEFNEGRDKNVSVDNGTKNDTVKTLLRMESINENENNYFFYFIKSLFFWDNFIFNQKNSESNKTETINETAEKDRQQQLANSLLAKELSLQNIEKAFEILKSDFNNNYKNFLDTANNDKRTSEIITSHVSLQIICEVYGWLLYTLGKPQSSRHVFNLCDQAYSRSLSTISSSSLLVDYSGGYLNWEGFSDLKLKTDFLDSKLFAGDFRHKKSYNYYSHKLNSNKNTSLSSPSSSTTYYSLHLSSPLDTSNDNDDTNDVYDGKLNCYDSSYNTYGMVNYNISDADLEAVGFKVNKSEQNVKSEEKQNQNSTETPEIIEEKVNDEAFEDHDYVNVATDIKIHAEKKEDLSSAEEKSKTLCEKDEENNDEDVFEHAVSMVEEEKEDSPKVSKNEKEDLYLNLSKYESESHTSKSYTVFPSYLDSLSLHPIRFRGLQTRARIWEDMGLNQRAFDLSKTAVELSRKFWFGINEGLYGETFATHSRLAGKLGKDPEAAAFAVKSLLDCLKFRGEDHVNSIESCVFLGKILAKHSNLLQQASVLATKATNMAGITEQCPESTHEAIRDLKRDVNEKIEKEKNKMVEEAKKEMPVEIEDKLSVYTEKKEGKCSVISCRFDPELAQMFHHQKCSVRER